MNTMGPGLIPDPFLSRHPVAGSVLVLLALVGIGVVVGTAVGSVLSQVVELLLGMVGGSA